MAEDAEVGSGTSSTTRLAENSSASVDMAEDAEVRSGVIGVMMKRSKDHLPRSRADLQGILSPYALKRWVSPNNFWPLLKLSIKDTIGKVIKQISRRATQGSHSNRSPNFFKPNYVWSGTHPKPRLQLGPRMFSLSTLPLYSPSVFATPSGWQNAFLPKAALVLQYVSNQANRQRLLTNLTTYQAWDLRTYQSWDIEVLRC